ncbi:hypothetical protein AUR04nite_33820 [Glutamicibacter uratoxydans]|uniref:Uncharacterized protein n=1 Tax=Glutamicibacter uratoxydans TaxID=43667 RepID=A0A4Y4DWR0_GLUUR|nr:hypothetical protein [Glutamicibacter uratoxydans]GED07850.1 hypothetical protein AUR04nite_33820 [Glutamicibacter uratoxydans]
MPAPAPNKLRSPQGGNLNAVLRGVVAAVAAGIFGTTIHASLFYAGDVPIIWGVGLAWLLLGLLVYWAAISSGKMWAGAIGFIGCYVTVGLISYVGHDQMILSSAYFKYLPGPTLASMLWMYGMVVPAVIALMAALRVMRRRHREA